MELPWLFLLLSFQALAVLVQGQQPGFLSLDCGISKDLNYTDDKNHIFYTSDAKFIDGGTYKEISSEYNTLTLQRQFRNLRSFPDGDRNCYTLTPVVESSRYLLRVSFMYGNYDGENKPPEFDVYVGVNRWDVDLPLSSDNPTQNEMIVFSTMDYLPVCLVNTGKGTPFISIIELRILNNSTYQSANASQSLQLYSRHHSRPISSGLIRFPDDAYDRIWSPDELPESALINTSSPINLREDPAYQPPLSVMNTAVLPYYSTKNLSFDFPLSHIDPRLIYHVFMHFAELVLLQSNQSRVFNLFIDGNHVKGPFSPSYLSVATVVIESAPNGLDQHKIELSKTESSSLDPLFNAREIFILRPLLATPTDDKEVNAIMNIKGRYQIKRNWMGDPCVPVKYSWHGLNCSYIHSIPPTIISLDLSSSGLTGALAPSLANLTSIQSLDVSNNSLTGPVPHFLTELSSLKVLNLSYNQFTGSIPCSLLKNSMGGLLSLSVDDSVNDRPNLCFFGPRGGRFKKRKNTILIAAPVTFAVILLILLIILWRFKWRKQDFGLNQNNRYKSSFLLSKNRRFTYAEVVGITNNFERSIGKGGFGIVYHGRMRDGTRVAVKMISQESVKSLSHPCQGSNEFQNEAQLLLRVHHRNLVPFIGYCQEGDNMALIYEYMAQGNLGSYLSATHSDSNALSWGQRLRIALDVAQGLEYLHNHCKPPIIHRDVKTTNILLNEKLEAKIGDFGLSKVFNDEFTHVTTAIKETFGYLDPEYYNSSNLTEKSDVYSFGVVLFQLITGKPAIIRISNSERQGLLDWLSPWVEGGDIKDVVDPRLEGEYDINFVQKAFKIALTCTRPRSIERPPMRDVVVELRECLGIDKALESRRSLKIEPVETCSADISSLSPR